MHGVSSSRTVVATSTLTASMCTHMHLCAQQCVQLAEKLGAARITVGGDAGGGDQRFELEEQPVGRAAASAPPQRFCVRLRPEGSGNKACIVVSPDA